MKFRIIHLYGFCIGLIILLSTVFIANNPVVVSKTYKTVKNLCAKIRSKELCVVLFDQSNFEKIEFVKKIKSIYQQSDSSN